MREQMTLIDPIDPSRGAARKARLDAARKRADRAITNVADKAGREWVEGAVERLRALAVSTYPGMFNVEQARLVIEQTFECPADLRAWGRVTQLAVKRGYLERVKGQFLPAASSNGAPKSVYRKGAKA